MNPSDGGCSVKVVLPQQPHSFLFADHPGVVALWPPIRLHTHEFDALSCRI
jgi:hypothetical protein